VTAETGDRRLRGLFFALALLYVLPFWVVRHLPTVDGPSHTYNAWILHQYGNVARYPLFQQYYEISAKPYPNWIGQAVMDLLMYAVPPLIAEKLLVSGYVLAFLAGAWYLAGAVRPGERWLAFLAFPFAFHQLFQYGFYKPLVARKIGRVMTLRQLAPPALTLGLIGSEERAQYTAIGSVTNLASRLCGEAADGQILIDSKVKAAIERHVEVVEIGDLALKGFRRAIRSFNVLGERGSCDPHGA